MKKIMKESDKSVRKYVNILGINVDSTTKEQVLTRVNNFLSHNTKFYIVTPNPELVLMAQSNNELKKALNVADISIPDGVGLKLSDSSLNIIKGRELFTNLISLADTKALKVFFLGGMGHEASVAASKLLQKHKKVKIETFSGPLLDKNLAPVTEVDRKLQEDAIDRINKFSPDFLFVAMANPRQEIWIYRNISKLKIKGAMTVGGTFRYIAGISKLPPKWMSSLGLEWLWRLVNEPYRFVRVLNALIVFPIKVWISRFKGVEYRS